MLERNLDTNPGVANPDIHLEGFQYERNPDGYYGDHIRNTTCVCNTSASHTYGNVMGVIQKYLLDLFPVDLFKTVTTGTSLSSRQITHVPAQLRKKELPMLVLVPRIMFGQDDNRFLSNTLFNSPTTSTYSFYGDGSLIPLAEDKHNNIWVHGHFNRAVMYIDAIMAFNTYSEQLNYMSYIHNMLNVGHNQLIRAPLELYIPKNLCNLIGNLSQIPMEKNNSVYEFLRYMNTIWGYPITYKLKGGSNTDEFFMYYITDIDMLVSVPEAGPGVKDGQIKRGFDISFSVRCEFNTIGYFALNSPDMKKPVNISDMEDKAIIPLFSDVINLNDFKLPVGWKILSWPIFKLAPDENSISIDNVLNESLRRTIDYHLEHGIPMERFIDIQFRENGDILSNELFYIDWAKRELILANPNPQRTYRLIISVSTEYINELLKRILNLE